MEISFGAVKAWEPVKQNAFWQLEHHGKKLGEQRHVFFPAKLRWTNAKYDFIDLVTDAYNHFIKNFYLK